MIQLKIEGLRKEWRLVRQKRLELKAALTAEGKGRGEVNHHRECKDLRKKQRHLSRMIGHCLKELSRRRARRGE